MPTAILPIYNSIGIHWYGIMMSLGILAGIFVAQLHPLKKTIFADINLIDTTIFIVGVGLIGARIFYVINNYEQFNNIREIVNIFNGGLWSIGGIITAAITLPLYLYYKNIPILSFLDFICLHVPLMQSIARIGCFLEGCCFGIASNAPWAYTPAGLSYSVHPTQLYSSFLLLLIFLYLYFYVQHRVTVPGQIGFIYLLLASIERFSHDFLRNDNFLYSGRKYLVNNYLSFFSINQWLCIAIAVNSLIGFYSIIYLFPNKISTKR